MSKAVLNYLERQSQAAVLGAVDAPRGVEVSKRVQAGVLGYAAFRHDACGDLDGRKPAGDDVGVILDLACAGREYKAKLALGAGKLPPARPPYIWLASPNSVA